jgi:hypothetical protein
VQAPKRRYITSRKEKQPPTDDDDNNNNADRSEKRTKNNTNAREVRRIRRRRSEKTHLYVCTDPFQLVDQLNNNNNGGDAFTSNNNHHHSECTSKKTTCGMHFYLAAVAGTFKHEWQAQRFRDLWGETSRGSAPRGSWGEGLSRISKCEYYIDVDIVFGTNHRASPQPSSLDVVATTTTRSTTCERMLCT